MTAGIWKEVVEAIIAIAVVLGAYFGYKSYQKGSREKLSGGWTVSLADAQSVFLSNKLKRIISRHLSFAKDKIDAGTHEPVNVRFYVDLMEAVVNHKELKAMAVDLASLIKHVVKYPYDTVAVPKNGNPLLGYAVAKKLKKRLLLVKDRGTKSGCLFDGKFRKSKTAILVDDVSSDGLFLLKPLKILSDHKINVQDCFVIVHRSEGSAKQKLRNKNVTLHTLCELSDEDIAKLRGIEPMQ